LSLSLHQYRSLVKRLAKGLAAFGLNPQEKVLLFSNNNVYFPVVVVGIVAAQGVFTGANPMFTPRELSYQLKDSEAKICFAARINLHVAVEAVDSIGMSRKNLFLFDDDITGKKYGQQSELDTLGIGGHWTKLLADKDDFVWKKFSTREEVERVAALNYSSGYAFHGKPLT